MPGSRVSEDLLKSPATERRTVDVRDVTTFAYMRTSTTEQNSDLQRDSISTVGVTES